MITLIVGEINAARFLLRKEKYHGDQNVFWPKRCRHCARVFGLKITNDTGIRDPCLLTVNEDLMKGQNEGNTIRSVAGVFTEAIEEPNEEQSGVLEQKGPVQEMSQGVRRRIVGEKYRWFEEEE